MKTLNQLPVPQDTDITKWPFGQLKNETATEPGTPVVREIYGDILTNVYKVLQDAGVVPNGLEDSEENGYQLLKALKNFSNELNDVEHVLILSESTWKITKNIDNFPDKYVMFCRASEPYVSGVEYSIAGTGANSYPMTSPTGFNASDEILVVFDQSGVRVYSLSFLVSSAGGIFPVFGNPVAFNDTNTLYYESEGRLITDYPAIHNIQQTIRNSTGISTLYVNEMFVLQGKVFCVVFNTEGEKYFFYQLPLTDLTIVEEVSVVGENNSPEEFISYFYTDGTYIYATNDFNQSAPDDHLQKYILEGTNMTFVQDIHLHEDFRKTTNAVIKGDALVSFVNGVLAKYGFDGSKEIIGTFNTLLGILFKFNSEIYYTNGEVAKKWNV